MASYRLAVRRDTAANWTSADPILAQGEFGFETDTNLLKVGDGVSAWSTIGYYDPNPALGTGGSLVGAFKYSNSYPVTAAGRFGFDNVNPPSITAIDISVISLNDFVWTGVADRVLPIGAQFVAIQKNDSTKWIHVEITSAFTNNTTHYTYDVTFVAVGPGGLPADGKECVVEIVQPVTGVLDDLDDVDTTTTAPVSGDILEFDGTNFVPVTPTAPTTDLVSLTDTTISSPANGEVLTYDGANWVNAAPTGGGGEASAYVREDGYEEYAISDAATSVTVDVPANTFDGMLMVACILWRTGTANAITPPAGWTLHTDAFDDKDIAGLGQRIAIYYRTASSEPANYTWTGTESQRMSGSITSVVGSTAIQSVTELTSPDNDTVNEGTIVNGTAPDNKLSIIVGTWGYAPTDAADMATITGDNIEYLPESNNTIRRLHVATSNGGGSFQSYHSGTDGGNQLASHGVAVIELDGAPIRVNEYNAPVNRDKGWRGPGKQTVEGLDASIGTEDFYFEIRLFCAGNAAYENLFTLGGDGVTTGSLRGRFICYKTNSNGIHMTHSTTGDSTSGTTLFNNEQAGKNNDKFINIIIQRESGVVTAWLNGSREYSGTPTTYTGFEGPNSGLHFFAYADGTTIGAANEGLVQEFRFEKAGPDNPNFVLPYDSTDLTLAGTALGFTSPYLENNSTGTNSITTGGTGTTQIRATAFGSISEVGAQSVSIGYDAGTTAGSNWVAIGFQAKDGNSGSNAIAIGYETATTGVDGNFVAIGYQAGSTITGLSSVSIGDRAGFSSTGDYTISIGALANYSSTGNRAITLNASGSSVNSTPNDQIRFVTGENDLVIDHTTGLQLTTDKLSSPSTMRLDPDNGVYIFPNLPTADPLVAGQLWNNSGVLTVSAG